MKALHWFDRYDISVDRREYDFMSPNLGDPVFYRVHPNQASTPMIVHHSRVLRFDGIRPPTKSGWTVYDQDFGVSELIPMITSIMEDQVLASAIAHLSQEASMKVLHIAGLREAIAGGGDPDETSPEQIGQDINRLQSIYRLTMLDEPGREELTRIAVQFGGLPDLMDRFQTRIASARDIPQTRWNGRAPAGMSATGESDGKNYVMMMEEKRQTKLLLPLMKLDAVLARNIGLREAPKYEWKSLLELSDKEIADASARSR